MADVQIVDEPYLFPGQCFFTGDERRIPIIDTGVNLPNMEGRVYMSFDFLNEILKATGADTPEAVQELRAENARLTAVNDKLPQALQEASDELRTLAARTVERLLAPDAGEPGDGPAGDEVVPEREPEPEPTPARPAKPPRRALSEQDRPGL